MVEMGKNGQNWPKMTKVVRKNDKTGRNLQKYSKSCFIRTCHSQSGLDIHILRYSNTVARKLVQCNLRVFLARILRIAGASLDHVLSKIGQASLCSYIGRFLINNYY